MIIDIMQYLYSSMKSQNTDKKKKITWDHLTTVVPTAYIHFRADWNSEFLFSSKFDILKFGVDPRIKPTISAMSQKMGNLKENKN